MAFQPIIDIARGRVWGYEALVRGTAGEGAGTILSQLTEATMYKFDQAARVRAIELAGRLFPADERTILSINFMPGAVYEPGACIRASMEAARRAGFPSDQLMFEFTENERVDDPDHLRRIVTEYKRRGLMTALDDFGAGYAGLTLLANLRTDLIKIDMELVRGIDNDAGRQAIVAGIVGTTAALGVQVIAEGLETEAEVRTARQLGITLMQGYVFARPGLETLPEVALERPVSTPATSPEPGRARHDVVAAVP